MKGFVPHNGQTMLFYYTHDCHSDIYIYNRRNVSTECCVYTVESEMKKEAIDQD